MENLINLSQKRKQWCDRFLDRCISVIQKTEKEVTAKKVSDFLMIVAGFEMGNVELHYMILKLEYKLQFTKTLFVES